MKNNIAENEEKKYVEGWCLPKSETHFEEYLLQVKNTSKKGSYQQKQRDRSLAYAKNWRTAIDIGACVGFWARDLCDKFQKVECFEPAPHSSSCLKENLSTRANWELHQVALSENHGEAELQIAVKGAGHSSIESGGVDADYVVRVPMKKLDDYSFKNIDYIKIDVQFHELSVLKGAEKTLSENAPVLCIECSSRTSEEIIYVGKITEFLFNLDYRVVDIIGKEFIFEKNGSVVQKSAI